MCALGFGLDVEMSHSNLVSKLVPIRTTAAVKTRTPRASPKSPPQVEMAYNHIAELKQLASL